MTTVSCQASLKPLLPCLPSYDELSLLELKAKPSLSFLTVFVRAFYLGDSEATDMRKRKEESLEVSTGHCWLQVWREEPRPWWTGSLKELKDEEKQFLKTPMGIACMYHARTWNWCADFRFLTPRIVRRGVFCQPEPLNVCRFVTVAA